jgi:hypothetical protein
MEAAPIGAASFFARYPAQIPHAFLPWKSPARAPHYRHDESPHLAPPRLVGSAAHCHCRVRADITGVRPIGGAPARSRPSNRAAPARSCARPPAGSQRGRPAIATSGIGAPAASATAKHPAAAGSTPRSEPGPARALARRRITKRTSLAPHRKFLCTDFNSLAAIWCSIGVAGQVLTASCRAGRR